MLYRVYFILSNQELSETSVSKCVENIEELPKSLKDMVIRCSRPQIIFYMSDENRRGK